ncbi:aldo/keto reductase [Arthrobacter psychrochitiniphilus]|uniref:2,5-diketo-D-gluconic acid reductase n=1 Tax=Arthrobacter psychrochitiniphilus TaxID=291045 RepID=A0A2V3DQY4_9MICC|nr:aldo/keto reductase [Arthrobacter psychrochitiniphilus]NYG18399.1 diketogulonate reductase-like aldo/keto reductase [Arthrobacter psychrochitiniphilus]PXA64554.1 2,5-diketo-D-gluconic acid reductase [Arthrobacter psychrochitiniphilus]
MNAPINTGLAGAVPVLTLNNGVTIPQLGFGVFQIPPEETRLAVGEALAAGYLHIDTAAAYRNEAGVGAAIAESGIPRDEIFLTTKLRNGEQGSPRAAFEASRKALGVDTIDLYLIHWPVPSQGLYVQAWRELEILYAEGHIRAIGVSNFLPEHLDELLANSTVVPAVNQIEVHPSFTQDALAQKSRSHDIAVQAYSPLGQGRDLSSPVVSELAAKYGATAAQIVLAWHLGLGNIVIPKSVTPQRIRENLAATSFNLSSEEIAAISALETGERIGADPAVAAFTQM